MAGHGWRIAFYFSPFTLAARYIPIRCNPGFGFVQRPQLVTEVFGPLDSRMHQLNTQNCAFGDCRLQYRFFDGLIRREAGRVESLRWRRTQHYNSIAACNVPREDCRGAMDVLAPGWVTLFLSQTRWCICIHQWPHCGCKRLHLVCICPFLSLAAQHTAPQDLTAGLPRATSKLPVDLDLFLGRQVVTKLYGR